MQTNPPAWRSLLYVPAHNDGFIAGAAKRGADAVILDLEDGVPESQKAAARANLKAAADHLTLQGVAVLVRVNSSWTLAWRDLEAALPCRPHAILLPKVEDAAHVRVIDSFLGELEAAAEYPPVSLVPLVETARGLLRAEYILGASPRIVAVIPGNEDLAAELGLEPEPETMLTVQLPLILAARAHNVNLLGLIGSGANFRDLDTYRERSRFAKRWGFTGATCIHPAQVPILNEVFAPTEAELEWAENVVKAFETSDGSPVQLGGRMIDLPVVRRAQALLRTGQP